MGHKHTDGGGSLERQWWSMDGQLVVAELKTSAERGLATPEAIQRREEYGANQLQQTAAISPLQIFLNQFKDFMVLVLIGAALISFCLGELADAVTILAIIILNAILGLVQEYRAERSLAALKQLSAPQARVLRDGKPTLVDNSQVVPGDILLLEAGDRIGADARLLAAEALEVNEAALTGESMPVAKTPAAIHKKELSLGDRHCMVYAGTNVTQGRGRAVVVATGMVTELGKIAHLLQSTEEDVTPLQQRLDQLGRVLVLICLFICSAVATMGILRGEPFRVMFLSGVSLAVAAIPEGLPAIVTISLAIGVQRMIRRNVLIRRLPAVETLGCATVICSDKTGTITQNQMVVTSFILAGKELRVEGKGYRPEGEIYYGAQLWRRQNNEYPDHFFQALVYCNNARLEQVGNGEWTSQGDPTEGALLALAAKAGYPLKNPAIKRLHEIPFSSERRRMSVTVAWGARTFLYTKGSVDSLLGLSTHVLEAEGIQPLTAVRRRRLEDEADRLAGKALRVLGIAYKPLAAGTTKLQESDEQNLIFLGMVGMMDPPRPEVKEAIRRCYRAGIRTVMITGDHPATARAVADAIGLNRGGSILTGAELEKLDTKSLLQQVGRVNVYARVSPKHKLLLVRTLKKQGEVVAMTGDGVNDAPAVKEANIGVAMGRTGTDVTKEASAMVITDDNFASMVAAVEEGRGIYENVRKSIRYLLGCNIGEVLTMFGASLLGLPLPLTPLQILWTNLVTDGLPAVALSMDPPDSELMNRPPRPAKEGIFGRGLGKRILLQGVAIGGFTLGVFALTLRLANSLVVARTMAYGCLVFSQLSYVFACRSEAKPVWQVPLGRNPYLLGAVGLSALMQWVTMNLPFLQRVFATVALTRGQWAWVIFTAVASVAVAEWFSGLYRWVYQRGRRFETLNCRSFSRFA